MTRRALTTLLVGVLIATMLPAVSAVAVDGDVELVPPDGQTAIKTGDNVRVQGSTESDATVDRIVLEALDATGAVLEAYEDGLQGLVTNDGGTLSGGFNLSCSLVPGCSTVPEERDPALRASVDAYRMSVDLSAGTDTSTITSPAVEFDEIRPRITGYFLIDPSTIEVRFSEDVFDPQGDSNLDWEVDGDDTAVDEITGEGDQRILHLRPGLTFGQDATPSVNYLPVPGNSLFPNTPYRDEAANEIPDAGRLGHAADRIEPDPPTITAIDGIATSRDDDDQAVPVVSNDPTPAVTVGEMTDGHTARLWLDDGDGTLEDDRDTFVGEAVASGGSAEITWPDGLALPDGTHRLFARALDGAACDPDDSSAGDCPNASRRSQDALYDLDTVAPVIDDPALASTQAITVTFSEPVTGPAEPEDWTVTAPGGGGGPEVTGVSGSGDSRVLQAEGVLEGSTLTYAPAGERLADAHGNVVADATVDIVAQPLPVVRLVDAEAEEQNGPDGPLDLTYEENSVDLGVELSDPPREGETVTVTLDVVADTATAGSDCDTAGVDYIDAGTVVREFSGEQTSATVSVQLCGDELDEFDETFRLQVVAVENAVDSGDTAVGTILDDDAPVALSVGDATVAEGGVGEVTVSIDTASGKDVSAAWSLRAGSATPGDDYEDDTGSLTIPAGETSTTVEVTTLTDQLHEGDETFELVLDESTNATIDTDAGDDAGTVTITDDDPAPSLRISDLETFEGDETRTEHLVVTLSEASGRDVTVDWATADGSATTADGDYTADSGTVTIPAGDISRSIPIEILGDTEGEDDETFTVELSNQTNATIEKGTGTVTLLDDDGGVAPPPDITVSVAGGEVGEGDALFPLLFPAEVTWTVTLSEPARGPIQIQYRTTDGGMATAGEDFEQSTGTLEIPAGEDSGEITADVIDDELYEADETVALQVDDPAGAVLANGADTMTTMATITDDDPVPTVAFADGSANQAVTEGDTATFTVELSAVSGRDTEVDWATLFDGTATTDDLPDQSDTVTIPAGQASETFQVTTTDNGDPDGDRTVSIELSNPSNADRGSPATSTLTITDDEVVTTTITLSGGEGNEDPGLLEPVTSPTPVPFTVELSRAVDQDVTVDYRTTSGGTATAESDFTATSGTLTIPAGDTSGTVPVEVLDDDLHEFDETVELELSQPVNARFGDGGPTLAESGTILDDDDPVTVSIGGDATVGEGESVVVDVTLDTESGRPVEVDYATADGSAAAGSDYDTASGTLTFEPGETTKQVTVRTLDDAEVEGDEDFRVELAEPVHAELGDDEAVVTITDDDEALPEQNVLSMSSAAQEEGDPPLLPFSPPATLDFTVSLRDPADGDVEVSWEAASDFGEHPATAGEDFEAGTGTVTIPDGQQEASIAVEVTPDLLDEFDETMVLTITGATGDVVVPGGQLTRTGRILDDDPPAAIAYAEDSVEVEVTEGADATLTVELDTTSGKDVAVTWTTSYNGTATTDDAPSQSSTVTVPAGETTATFEVETTDNGVRDGDRDFSVVLSAPQAATLSEDAPTTATVTILDDDLPVLSIEGGSIDEGEVGTLGSADPGTGLEAASTGPIRDADSDASPGLVVAAVSPLEEDLGFTVSLAEAFDQDITVQWTTTDRGTATAGSDYTAASGTLEIPAGETEGEILVDVLPDDLDEYDETVVVRFSDPQGARFADGVGSVEVAGTIIDDDPLVTVDLGADQEVTEGEPATFDVNLSAVSGKDITLRYRTSDGSATAGQDYTAADDTLTIPAGDTSRTFTIPTLDDATFEPTEDVQITLSVVDEDTAELGRSNGTLTITDDDLGVNPNDTVVSLTGDAVEEGDPTTPLSLPLGGNSLVFEVRLSEPADGDVVIDYETRAGTATADDDFEPASGQVTIPDGQEQATVSIAVVGDFLDEFDEDLQLVLTDVSGGAVIPGGELARTGRIIDDDPAAQLRVSDATVLEGSVAELDVTLDSASGKDITVGWSLVDGSATAGDDYVDDSGTLSFPAGTTSQTVEVATLADDDTGELIEQFELVLSGATNAGIDDGRGTISIVDIGADGLPTVTAVFLEDITTQEGDSDHTALVPVRLSSASDQDTTVTWSSQELTATAGEDYRAEGGQVTIPAGETEASIPVTIIGDAEVEPNEDFLVLLTEAEGAVITGPTGRVTITDDDGDGDDGGNTPGGGDDSDGAPDGGELPATGGGAGLALVGLAALLARRRRD